MGEDFSDLDIGILMEREVQQPLEFELKLHVGLEKALRYPVDVRILNSAALSYQFAVVLTAGSSWIRILIGARPSRVMCAKNISTSRCFECAIIFFPTPKTLNYQM
jgi:hypothetical protein